MYFHLTDRSSLPTLATVPQSFVRHMDFNQIRLFDGQRAQERVDDGRGDLPLSQNHPAQLYRYLQSRQIPAFKLGKEWRFVRSDLEQWIRDRTRTTLAS